MGATLTMPGHAHIDIALIGFGAIGQTVARLLHERGARARIVAVGLRDAARTRPNLPPQAQILTHPAALADSGAQLVVEVAGRDSVAEWGHAALQAGQDFAVSSTSAFADAALLQRMTALARSTGARIIIPPGALGGIDALAAGARMGLTSVEHRIIKPPAAWAGTEAEAACDLDALDAPVAFFSGSADAAAARFARNANVALITALAGLGPAQTRVTLIADPTATGNRHEIDADGAFGEMRLQLANKALPDNPKSSALTALSLVRLIENRVEPLVI